jgi:uncharacterized pyridoxal phosphate-containing UPF0001 family protein
MVDCLKLILDLKYLTITGLMTVCPFTENKDKIRDCFKALKWYFEEIKLMFPDLDFIHSLWVCRTILT